MKGIILRGLYDLKRPKRLILIGLLLAFNIMMAFLIRGGTGGRDSAWVSAGIVGIVMCMVPLSLLTEDEQTNWTMYLVNTPLSRKKYVTAIYLYYILTGALMVLLSTVVPIMVGLGEQEESLAAAKLMGAMLTGPFSAGEYLLGYVTVLMLGMIMLSLMLPVSLRWGKNPLASVLAGMLILPVVGTILSVSDMDAVMQWLGNLIGRIGQPLTALIGLAVAAGFLSLSRLIAVRWFEKREF